jgi:hypothetical protein
MQRATGSEQDRSPAGSSAAEDGYTTFATADFWRALWLQEAGSGAQCFLTRRERRLNASLPYP